MTWFKPTKDKWPADSSEQVELESTVVSSIELSYSIASKGIGSNRNWMYTLALLHISNPEEFLSASIYFDNSLTARTLSFTEFTGYADVSVDVTPLIRLTASGSYYQDGSYFYGLTSNYSMSDNCQLTFVLQHFDGKNDSLFVEIVNTSVYVNIGWYF